MRSVRVSNTYILSLRDLLAFGEDRYGRRIIEEKRALVRQTIVDTLRLQPRLGLFDSDLGLFVFAVSRTPFVLLYSFDDRELRIHFICHKSVDRSAIDPIDVAW
jgi:hypothetical protein